MRDFTIMDGVVVAVVSILVVFLVLIGLQLVINFFKFFSGKNHDLQMKMNKEDIKEERNYQPDQTPFIDLPVNEELKTVAALTALILANNDRQDKQYRIISIKRIR